MTEPSIIEYYSDYPKIVSVIDDLNKECEELRKINEKLKQDIFQISKKYNRELKEYKKINELKLLLLEIAYENKNKKKFGCF
jgi:predicted RNase H-like nuclease (RuvC/YqgF family)